MTVYVVQTDDAQQRMLPEDLQRLTRDGTILLGRLAHYKNTGTHPPTVADEVMGESWYSVFQEAGASPGLVDMISTSLDLWPSLVSDYEDTFDRLSKVTLRVGDRFIVHGDDRAPYYSKLRYKAVNLEDEVSYILEAVYFSHSVTGSGSYSFHSDFHRHTPIVEALEAYRSQVYAIISEPRLWRADGKINEKKAVKLLCDNVSDKLERITAGELAAIALHWKGDEGIVARKTNAGEKGKVFEDEVERLFVTCGFKVETTASSGDYGVDLVVSDAEMRLAVQVKNLDTTVGISAVQEVSAGALHYKCTHTLVVANNGFTDAARILASSTGTRLETLHSLRQYLRRQMAELLTS